MLAISGLLSSLSDSYDRVPQNLDPPDDFDRVRAERRHGLIDLLLVPHQEGPVDLRLVERPPRPLPACADARRLLVPNLDDWRDDGLIEQCLRGLLMPDEKKIRQVVTALGPDAVEVVGGIEVLRDTIVAVR